MSTRRPKILMLITKADVGGAQIHVLELIRSLRDQYDFTLACGEDDFLTTEVRALGIDVVIFKHLVRPIRLRTDWRAIKELVIFLKQNPHDLLHAHSSKAGVIGRIAAKRAKVSSLFTAHGWAFTPGVPKLQRIYGVMVEFVLGRIGDGIITISDFDAKQARFWRIGKINRRWTVKNCVPAVSVRSSLNHQPVTLLHIGRLSYPKNQLRLLHLVAQLQSDFRLHIVGDGTDKPELIAELNYLDLSDRVSVHGGVTDVAPWLAKTDIFLLTSRYEGLPLSVLEAMSAGLPVVSTDAGGVKEAVKNDCTGYVIDQADDNDFIEKLGRLIEDVTLRQRLGEGGYQRYLKHFTFDKMQIPIANIYADFFAKR